ncbi:hypothetical protein [Actinomadura harenae]|uniref:Uncharacterized protein n=1 Tax=Actinomadura harenae TaxID=2483351 RepID=A0A3M2M117_9ACTN|nr:hypothetical protein [Actinomadura harenae]RMI42115.1 hypothetical protein EBO15_20925 [Actinomadura harenae]
MIELASQLNTLPVGPLDVRAASTEQAIDATATGRDSSFEYRTCAGCGGCGACYVPPPCQGAN